MKFLVHFLLIFAVVSSAPYPNEPNNEMKQMTSVPRSGATPELKSVVIAEVLEIMVLEEEIKDMHALISNIIDKIEIPESVSADLFAVEIKEAIDDLTKDMKPTVTTPAMKVMAMGHHKKHHRHDQDGSGKNGKRGRKRMHPQIIEKCE